MYDVFYDMNLREIEEFISERVSESLKGLKGFMVGRFQEDDDNRIGAVLDVVKYRLECVQAELRDL